MIIEDQLDRGWPSNGGKAQGILLPIGGARGSIESHTPTSTRIRLAGGELGEVYQVLNRIVTLGRRDPRSDGSAPHQEQIDQRGGRVGSPRRHRCRRW
jgi:hypothetical protein